MKTIDELLLLLQLKSEYERNGLHMEQVTAWCFRCQRWPVAALLPACRHGFCQICWELWNEAQTVECPCIAASGRLKELEGENGLSPR